MIIGITLFAITIFLPGLLTWAFYKFIPQILWCVPIGALIVSSCLFLRDINSITSEPAFAGKWALYFHNDWSMGFYLIYLPVVVASAIFTLVAYMIKHLKENPPKTI
jgi:hypothetical protein